MYNTQQLEVLRNALSAVIVSPERLLIGETEGLYMLDVVDEELYKFSDKDMKKVTQIRVLAEEGLIALLAGTCLEIQWWTLAVSCCARQWQCIWQ